MLDDPIPATRLSDDLEALRAQCDGKSLTLGELESALKGRGFAVLLMLLALPFCFAPVPGLSMPFGAAVFLMALRIAAGQAPWLPVAVRAQVIPANILAALIQGGIRFAYILEKMARPRMHFLQRWPGMMNLIGVSIALSGFVLLLPLPIPFSNLVPAWAVVFLATGMMERDGLLVLIGHFVTVLSWVFLALCWILGAKGVEKLLELF